MPSNLVAGCLKMGGEAASGRNRAAWPRSAGIVAAKNGRRSGHARADVSNDPSQCCGSSYCCKAHVIKAATQRLTLLAGLAQRSRTAPGCERSVRWLTDSLFKSPQ